MDVKEGRAVLRIIATGRGDLRHWRKAVVTTQEVVTSSMCCHQVRLEFRMAEVQAAF
jgi:hypothetical protein